MSAATYICGRDVRGPNPQPPSSQPGAYRCVESGATYGIRTRGFSARKKTSPPCRMPFPPSVLLTQLIFESCDRIVMKYLLTSAGIKNRSIYNALLDLLGKPIADCSALCIPTAGYGHPLSGPGRAWNFISGKEPECPMCELGWKSLGVLELTALPTVDKERWVGWVRQADVLLVNGGDAVYLGHRMRQSGLADLLPSLDKTV